MDEGKLVVSSSDGMYWYNWFIEEMTPLLRKQGIILLEIEVPESEHSFITGNLEYWGCEAKFTFYWSRKTFRIAKTARYILVCTNEGTKPRNDQQSDIIDREIHESCKWMNVLKENPHELVSAVHEYCEGLRTALLSFTEDFPSFQVNVERLFVAHEISILQNNELFPVFYYKVNHRRYDVYVTLLVGACVHVKLYPTQRNIRQNVGRVLSDTAIKKIQKDSAVDFYVDKLTLLSLYEKIEEYCTQGVRGIVEYGGDVDSYGSFIKHLSYALANERVYLDEFKAPKAGTDHSTGRVSLNGCDASIKYYWQSGILEIAELPKTTSLRIGRWANGSNDTNSDAIEREIIQSHLTGTFKNPLPMAVFISNYCKRMEDALLENPEDPAEFEKRVKSLFSAHGITVIDFTNVISIEYCSTIRYREHEIEISFTVGACVYINVCMSEVRIMQQYDVYTNERIKAVQKDISIGFFADRQTLIPLADEIEKYCSGKDMPAGVFDQSSSVDVEWCHSFFGRLKPLLEKEGVVVCDFKEPMGKHKYFTFSAILIGCKANIEYYWKNKFFVIERSEEYIHLLNGTGVAQRQESHSTMIDRERTYRRVRFNVDGSDFSQWIQPIMTYCEEMKRGLLAVSVASKQFEKMVRELFSNSGIEILYMIEKRPVYFVSVKYNSGELCIVFTVGACLHIEIIKPNKNTGDASQTKVSEDEIKKSQLDDMSIFYSDINNLSLLIKTIKAYGGEVTSVITNRVSDESAKDSVAWGRQFISNLKSVFEREEISIVGLQEQSMSYSCSIGRILYFGCEILFQLHNTEKVIYLKKSPEYICLVSLERRGQTDESFLQEIDFQTKKCDRIIRIDSQDHLHVAKLIKRYLEELLVNLLDVPVRKGEFRDFETEMKSMFSQKGIRVVNCNKFQPVYFVEVAWKGVEIILLFTFGVMIYTTMYISQKYVKKRTGKSQSLPETEIRNICIESRKSFFVRPRSLNVIVEHLSQYVDSQSKWAQQQNPTQPTTPSMDRRTVRLPPMEQGGYYDWGDQPISRYPEPTPMDRSPYQATAVEGKENLTDLLKQMERLVDKIPPDDVMQLAEVRRLLIEIKDHMHI
jgi:hypothetical protein